MTKFVHWIIRLFFFVLFVVLMILKLPQIWLAIYAVGILVAPLFGRLYCGYVCPMGIVMRPVQKLSKSIGLQKKHVPSWTYRYVLPSIMLVITIVVMIIGKRATGKQLPVIPILTVLSVVITFFLPSQFFHNAICPFSIPLRLASRKALWTKHVDTQRCKGTRKCVRVCPSGAITVDATSNKARIDRSLCHQCELCSSVCPTDAIARSKMNV
ncbi:MAG: 4Fe-4S binding protein [Sphaerochaetaceae bacterium]|jgi:polyferredoxin|nr:4Fe-4S binding protein [Sphaerochaetaceae bacterium]NLO61115.1 4Fe-4S binding protein [Spirochaetales bacterium]MDD2404869.1 4Fe-4S binding protein [Sphaerochaetaceae bacterium]MDD3669910.1 4Fe-4S binding protein [Sphaerochaetaceae bacterium]MDD4259764.1 4Fe-4S binding protein [Sphaerochaetaceae bacterium]